MGIFGTRWEAEFEGHEIVVSRNEWTKGFKLEWDGTEIAHRTWSLIGLGELHATAQVDDHPHEVHVALAWESIRQLDGQCTIRVDGEAIPVKKVK